MARDLFGVEDEVLLARRRQAQEELMRGKSILSHSDGNVNGTNQIILHARAAIREINTELRLRNHPEAPPDATHVDDFVTVRFA